MAKAKLALFLIRHRKLIRIGLIVLLAVGAYFVWQEVA